MKKAILAATFVVALAFAAWAQSGGDGDLGGDGDSGSGGTPGGGTAPASDPSPGAPAGNPGNPAEGGGFIHLQVPAVWPPFMLQYPPEQRHTIWWWTYR